MLVVFFFFFKQKTAYEMRISDWSSDVSLPISSNPDSCRGNRCSLNSRQCIRSAAGGSNIDIGPCQRRIAFTASALRNLCDAACVDRKSTRLKLQSLMRISYAVFCLIKKQATRYSTEQQRGHDEYAIQLPLALRQIT